jgi:hypothetical protein
MGHTEMSRNTDLRLKDGQNLHNALTEVLAKVDANVFLVELERALEAAARKKRLEEARPPPRKAGPTASPNQHAQPTPSQAHLLYTDPHPHPVRAPPDRRPAAVGRGAAHL